jgi:hypothetical protein
MSTGINALGKLYFGRLSSGAGIRQRHNGIYTET